MRDQQSRKISSSKLCFLVFDRITYKIQIYNKMEQSKIIYIVVGVATSIIFTIILKYLVNLWCDALCKAFCCCDCSDDKKDTNKSKLKLGQNQVANMDFNHPVVLATRKYFELKKVFLKANNLCFICFLEPHPTKGFVMIA